jgi:hypothetical protein
MRSQFIALGGLLLALAGSTAAAIAPTPIADASNPAPLSAPTPPPARNIVGDGYVRPGCPTMSCLPCGSGFDVGLAATAATDCHRCACFPQATVTSAIPASCTAPAFCYGCGYNTAVTLAVPTTATDNCPQCACATTRS